MRRAAIFALSFVILFTPLVVFGGGSHGIVPTTSICGEPGDPLQGKDLIHLINHIIEYAVYLTIFVATIMFAYAGFLYVTAAARTENHQKARSVFSSVLIGFVIVISAWLIVDIILTVFTDKDFGFWVDIDCGDFAEAVVPPQAPGTVDRGAGGVGGGTGVRCQGDDCLSQNQAALLLAQNGINTSSTGSCSDYRNRRCTSLEGLEKDTVEDLVAVEKSFDGEITVSGGTEVGHDNGCHISGSCVDVKLSGVGSSGNYDVEKINKFIEESKKVGRCPVFEPRRGGSCPVGVTSCQRVSGSTGDHFSFYACN